MVPLVQANTVNCSAVFRCNLLNQTPSVSPFQPKHFCWVDTSDQCHPFIQALPSVSAVKHCQLFSHALLSTVQPNTVSVNLFNKTPPLAVQPKAVSVTCTTKDSVSAVKTKQPMSQLLLSAVQPSHMLPITMHCQCQLSSQTLSAVQPNIAVSCSAKHCCQLFSQTLLSAVQPNIAVSCSAKHCCQLFSQTLSSDQLLAVEL